MTLAVFGTMLSYMTVSSFTPGPGNLLALNNTTQYGFSKSKKIITRHLLRLLLCANPLHRCGVLFKQFHLSCAVCPKIYWCGIRLLDGNSHDAQQARYRRKTIYQGTGARPVSIRGMDFRAISRATVSGITTVLYGTYRLGR